MSSVWIIVPSFNEGSIIGTVTAELETLAHEIVVVDDGSDDDTYEVVRRMPRVHLLRHAVNLGQGAALRTGIEYALQNGAQTIVTFDADGQHDVTDVATGIRLIATSGVDVVLGSRFLGTAAAMPRGRRALLKAAVAFTRLHTGLTLTDTHVGLRVLTRAAAMTLKLQHSRMAHATEILQIIARRRLTFVEMPISMRYTPYSLAKGQSALDSWAILLSLLRARLLP